MVVTILLAAFTIVFGELVPKSLALAHPERTALTLAGPVDMLGRILAPIVSLLTWTTRKIAGGLGGGRSRAAPRSAPRSCASSWSGEGSRASSRPRKSR